MVVVVSGVIWLVFVVSRGDTLVKRRAGLEIVELSRGLFGFAWFCLVLFGFTWFCLFSFFLFFFWLGLVCSCLALLDFVLVSLGIA